MKNVYNGECILCGIRFCGMSKSEYAWNVSRHIATEHPDASMDDDVIQPL